MLDIEGHSVDLIEDVSFLDDSRSPSSTPESIMITLALIVVVFLFIIISLIRRLYFYIRTRF